MLPLALKIVTFIRGLMDNGWKVIVVFDGDSPPAKRGTADKRREKREAAIEKLKQATTKGEEDKCIRQIVSITPRIIARLSRLIKWSCGCDTFTAPFEADSQLVLMEQQLRGRYPRLHVHATDSDLIALGCHSLLWKIDNTSANGQERTGQAIRRSTLYAPPQATYDHTERGSFLRLLHGGRTGILASPESVDARILDFANVDGNDYARFSKIGKKAACAIALPSMADAGSTPSIVDTATRVNTLARGVVARGGYRGDGAVQEVEARINVSLIMLRHSVVWDMRSGVQRRFLPLQDPSPAAEALAALSSGSVDRSM